MLQFVLKIATFSLDKCLQPLTPLFDCTVYDSLVKLAPLFHQALSEMCYISDPSPVDTLLEHTPYLIINRV